MSYKEVNPMRKKLSKSIAAIIPVILIGGTCGDARAAEPADGEIIGIYIQVNGFDIETALLGRAQASSAEARKLAEHVAADHLAVRQSAYALAEKCGVAPVLPSARAAAAADHDKAMTKLLALKGAAFDQAYAAHEVAFHSAAIDAVKTALLPAAKCGELRAHFKEVLPAFEHHLSMTQELAAHVGKAKS